MPLSGYRFSTQADRRVTAFSVSRSDRTIVYGTASGGTTIDADEYGGNPFATALIQISREHDQTLAALLPQLRALTYTGSGKHQTPSWVLQPHDGAWSFPLTEGSRAERRVALVLVVSDYTFPGVTPLAGAAHDERRVAAMLASHGFTVVQGIHSDRQSLLKALRSFARHSRNADVALVYCTGHGVEQAHQVHLLPANYPFDSGFRSTTLNRNGIPVQRIATACRATNVNLTFFAGCRTPV